MSLFHRNLGNPFSPRMLLQRKINPRSRTRRKWRGKQRRATNSILHTVRPLRRRDRRRTSTTTSRGRAKCIFTVKGSLIQTPSTGSTWPGHKKRDCSFGRQGPHAINYCSRFSDGRLHRKSGFPEGRQNKTLHASARSEDSQRCLQIEAAVAVGHIEVHRENLLRRRTKTQKSTGKPVAEEANPFNIDLRIQGIPQDAVTEGRGRMSKIQDLVDKLRTEYQTESIVVDLEKGNSTGSAKNQNVQLENWEILNCMSWQKFR